MSLRTRIYIKPNIDANSTIDLDQYHSHYLASVLRCKAGDEIRIFNEYSEWKAEIISCSKKSITIKILEKLRDAPHERKLSLIFSPIKNVDTNFIIQKATELGVTDIYPVICRRTVVDKVNETKLNTAAIEAAEQCERFKIPIIHKIQKLERLILNPTFSGSLVFFYEKANNSLKEGIKDIAGDDDAILIGPEGGFSDEEASSIIKQNFTKTVKLGNRIMRAETAIISAISAYNTLITGWS